jgi:hypothetical protein
MNILSVTAEVFHANRMTDRHADRHDEENSSFSQFWERSQILGYIY